MAVGYTTFDGTTGLIVVPSAPSLDPGAVDFSIDAWINPRSDALLPIVTKRFAPADLPVGYAFTLESRRLSFIASNDASSMAATAPVQMPLDGQWHFVAVTIERGSPTGGRLYIDGALVHVFDTTVLVGAVDTLADLYIAEQAALGRGQRPAFFDGGIDEIELFHRALSALEITSIFQAGAEGKCNKPVPRPLEPPLPPRTATRPVA